MLPIFRTERAERDFREIVFYLDDKSPAAADRFVDAIEQKLHLLSDFPLMGRSREELAPGLRSVIVEKYVLFYRVEADSIQVVRILHGRRDFPSIFREDEE